MYRMILPLAAMCLMVSQIPAQTDQSMKGCTVMTYNIRFNNPDDGVNAWPLRKAKVFEMIAGENPDIIGIQEALSGQVQDFEQRFTEYGRIGVGRDDGKEGGEFSAIFYSRQKFRLLGQGTFWLSATPSVAGSRGWDAACNRVVSWGRFIDKSDGKEFCVFNTHFDHMGVVARRESARLLLRYADSISKGGAAIVTGDFNSVPGSEPLKILTTTNAGFELTDSRSLAKVEQGPPYTFTGFKVGEEPRELIDYIFVHGLPTVYLYKVNDVHEGGYYPSDHLPVIIKLSLYPDGKR